MLSKAPLIPLLLSLFFAPATMLAQHGMKSAPASSAARATAPQKIILDTDIGDDIDDAYALALALQSPQQVDLLGVTTAWGNTQLRARLVQRFLDVTGHRGIPVSAGPETKSTAVFSQARWAEAQPLPVEGSPNAIDFILRQIHRYPHQITLVAIAPYSNIGALIQRDPAAFRQLRRVVLMGGSIHRGYGDLGYQPSHGPDAEYNVAMDIPASQALFTSGVPIYMMPLDSTQLKLDEVMRPILFGASTPVTNALAQLTSEWMASSEQATPTLYDAMAMAYVLKPSLCPTTPLHVTVDDKGFTRVTPGEPNANVCLQSNSSDFFHFLLPRLMGTAPK
ncbi:MAG: nucleoside hydrolase [Acidobacteriaceae bacterium]